ncbi:unnamed protein product [Zymoseptoria tritici ST99CH_1E4]|uniref:UBC core domain-containing protein n=1 Tax=Zymoseptoria tritici ST99CH_1E4 TaxID=1276532 RepID=A0A2H1G6W9_ZYMTR|nr:unnamed protein product [Zymoseptoria tritici ST99CH_1E4]
MTSPPTQRRLEKELENFTRDPPPNCFAKPDDESNILTWTAIISGPKDSPYAGGRFELIIQYPYDYPLQPPAVRFKTKIYHPNVDIETGFIGMDILREGWSPVLTIGAVLLSVQAMMSDPEMGCVLAREFETDRGGYVERAKEWARVYAKDEEVEL